MATVNFSVPDDVKAAFNEAFKGENKSAVLAELMRQAIEDKARRERRKQAVEAIANFREEQQPLRSAEFDALRKEGRM